MLVCPALAGSPGQVAAQPARRVQQAVGLAGTEMWTGAPVVLGVPWQPSERLVRTGADLAAMMGTHLICAFVDPASYLTEWEPTNSRTGVSLDPETNRESDFPASEVLQRLQDILGPPRADWSFRVLNGDVPYALSRLAESTDASMLIVGGPRPGRLAGVARLLEESISASLIRSQSRPVVVLPRPES